MTDTSKRSVKEYVLGHSNDELTRLNAQARLIAPFTKRFFVSAGLQEGMRVLDVGSGAGDVAILARELVGESGEVVGADLSETGIATARQRVSATGYGNISFHVGDPTALAFDGPFDAVIGRYVLMFQSAPSEMLSKLVTRLKPGGIIVFHEAECADARSKPQLRSYDQSWRWVVQAIAPADTSFAAKFPAVFDKAGLPAPTLGLEALIGGGSNSADCVDLVVGLVSTLLPEIERRGIASVADVRIDTLKDRILKEAAEMASVLIGRSEVGAWCRVS